MTRILPPSPQGLSPDPCPLPSTVPSLQEKSHLAAGAAEPTQDKEALGA